MNPLRRFGRFQIVGAMGMVVQLSALQLLHLLGSGDRISSPASWLWSLPWRTTSFGICITPGETAGPS